MEPILAKSYTGMVRKKGGERMKPAYDLMQEPLTVDPKREFRIVGHITSILIDVRETVIKIQHTSYSQREDNQTTYVVTFFMPRKIFVDKHVKTGDLVMCIGELKMKEDGNILLEGNYAIAFRGMEHIWEEPNPAYVDPDDIPEEDRAY